MIENANNYTSSFLLFCQRKKNKFVFDLFLQPQFCEFKDEDIVVEKKPEMIVKWPFISH